MTLQRSFMNPFESEHSDFRPDQFCGTVRMFPIPNLVMFPHVVQPLHIFEERYRELMEDALAGDQLIAMPVLKPGWEPDYAGRPPLERWACLGQVVLHNRLPDGCFNLLLMGVARLQIDRELEPLRSFRQAEARLVADVYPAADGDAGDELRRRLVVSFQASLPQGDAPESVRTILQHDLPLGQLTDLLAYVLPLKPRQKLALLAEPNVLGRAEQLLTHLQRSARDTHPAEGPFPPPFSAN